MCSDRALKTQSAVGIAPTASHTASFKTEQLLLIFPLRRGKKLESKPPAEPVVCTTPSRRLYRQPDTGVERFANRNNSTGFR